MIVAVVEEVGLLETVWQVVELLVIGDRLLVEGVLEYPAMSK
jgi:hypothetical protein